MKKNLKKLLNYKGDNKRYEKEINNFFKIPYELEKQNLLYNIHNKTEHTGYHRLYDEIINKKYFWKGIMQDCIDYVNLCPICLKNRGCKNIILNPKHIIYKDSKKRYVVDGWELYETLDNESGFKWVIDIIDYFSKYMASFPIVDNNDINALNSIKEFCIFVGFPTILQTDNGVKYCNNLIENFCFENNIRHIKGSPRHPQINGVVEISHKEIRKIVIQEYSNSEKNFYLKNSLLDAVNFHNHNFHYITGYRPIDIINNTDDEIYKSVLENTKKNLNYEKKDYDNIETDNHLLIKSQVHKVGKNNIKKNKSKLIKFQQVLKLILVVVY